MDRAALLKLWDQSWDEGIWVAPWSKAVAGLSARRAAWRPRAGRHSIWEIVNHVSVWREYTLMKLGRRRGPKREEMAGLNFVMPEKPTGAAWRASVRRLRRTHREVRAAIADRRAPLERLRYHLGHDCYHLGQIMYLRAMQGMKPIE